MVKTAVELNVLNIVLLVLEILANDGFEVSALIQELILFNPYVCKESVASFGAVKVVQISLLDLLDATELFRTTQSPLGENVFQ